MAAPRLDVLISNRTNAPISIFVPETTAAPEYTSAYFAANNHQKPELAIANFNNTAADLRGTVKAQLTTLNLDLPLAISFVYAVLKGIKVKSATEWKSFGVNICRANDEINPFVVLNVVDSTVTSTLTAAAQANANDDMWMCAYILSVYRVNRSTYQIYTAALLDKINSQLKSLNRDAVDMTEAVSTYKTWSNDNSFQIVMAGLDMFLNRYRLLPCSVLGIGTLVSRFRDCAALMSIGYLCRLGGYEHRADSLAWVWTRIVGDELERLMKENEELDQDDSYMPYLVSMCLSKKSPYSTTVNPAFHFFANAVGTMMSSSRGANARQCLDNNTANIMENAFIMAYVLSNRAALEEIYRVGNDPVLVFDIDNNAVNNLEPANRLARDWYLYTSDRQFMRDDKMKEFALLIVSRLTTTRSGTIGEYIARNIVK